jgi:hypothetical protein
MNYKKMWKQLETEMVGLKIKGEDLVKKYAGTKSGGNKAREANAVKTVVTTLLGRMLGIEQEQKNLEEAKAKEGVKDDDNRNETS